MASLPSYVAEAKPVPQDKRVPWFTSTAQTYAGIMLWFVFWTAVPVGEGLGPGSPYSKYQGGMLAQGVGVALVGLLIAALICHFLFYLVPGKLGRKTGLPLYIVGTSTYGVIGGFFMPGFLMGVLQFGWLAVNGFFAGMLLGDLLGLEAGNVAARGAIAAVWIIAATFMGLKGIQYVARVATFLPLLPLAVLLILFVASVGGIADFSNEKLISASVGEKFEKASKALEVYPIICVICTYVVGFFATAGAAGCDFGMNNRDDQDVQLGGLFGIFGATMLAGGLAILIVAGAHGAGKSLDPAAVGATSDSIMQGLVGAGWAKVMMFMLVIAAFPPACFSSFIAANSFKTTLPNVNPWLSCGVGAAVAIFLAVTGYAGDAIAVFSVIGASFGPICGAMAADYILSGFRWNGPRAGFNPAGWISWFVGFLVGASALLINSFSPVKIDIITIMPPPVAAFVVGFVLYYVLAKAGMVSQTLPMPAGVKNE